MLLSHLATMHGHHTRIRALLHRESVVARAAPTADGTRQEPSTHSSVMSLAVAGEASHGPNGGVADSLDEARAAFRAQVSGTLLDT